MKLREAVLILNPENDPKGTPAVLSRVKADLDTHCKMTDQICVYFSNGNRTWKYARQLASTEARLLKRLEERGLRCPATALRGGDAL